MLDRDLAKAFSLGPLGALLAACLILVRRLADRAADREPSPQSELAEEDPAQATDDSAMLYIIAANETEILLDGKPIGKTPLNGYKVAPGSHDVTFVDEKTGTGQCDHRRAERGADSEVRRGAADPRERAAGRRQEALGAGPRSDGQRAQRQRFSARSRPTCRSARSREICASTGAPCSARRPARRPSPG